MPYLSLTCIDKRLGDVDEPSSRSAALKTAVAVLRSRARNTRDRDDDAVRPWSDRGQPEWIPNVPETGAFLQVKSPAPSIVQFRNHMTDDITSADLRVEVKYQIFKAHAITAR